MKVCGISKEGCHEVMDYTAKSIYSLQLAVYFFPLWLNYKVLHELLFTTYGQN